MALRPDYFWEQQGFQCVEKFNNLNIYARSNQWLRKAVLPRCGPDDCPKDKIL
jgi:hypothetical protein